MKLDGVDLEDINFLRDQILFHFDSFYVFYKTAELQMKYIWVIRTLEEADEHQFRKEHYEKIKEAFYKAKKKRKVKYIQDEDREAIRKCIRINFDKYVDFCKKHKQFDSVYVTNVVSGRLKLASRKYEKLLNLLVKKYNLELN